MKKIEYTIFELKRNYVKTTLPNLHTESVRQKLTKTIITNLSDSVANQMRSLEIDPFSLLDEKYKSNEYSRTFKFID